MARYLGDAIDLTTFDFKTGKINSNLLRRSKRSRSDGFGRSYRNEGSLIPPIRQTASIFKQPVTLIKTQPDSKVKSDLKSVTSDKPKQVFWEKRLQSFRATTTVTEEMERFELPKNIRLINGPDLTDDTALRSLATALHLHSQPITGQTCARSTLEKNPGVFINPEQPLVSAIVISDDDIRRQEQKVKLARRSLQAIIA